MTRLGTLFALVSVALGLQTASPAPMASEDIQRIIQACDSTPKTCPKSVTVRQGLMISLMWATISGPEARIGTLAMDAKREYKKLVPSDIPEDIATPLITFTVSASRPEKVNEPSHDVEHVFLRKKGAAKEDVIRPVKEMPVTDTLRNGLGATTTITDMMAFFNKADVPSDDFEIVALVKGWREQNINVKLKDMERVR